MADLLGRGYQNDIKVIVGLRVVYQGLSVIIGYCFKNFQASPIYLFIYLFIFLFIALFSL